ncbi:unnamed protein product [Pleuronectes platessa]|uniref:Uncharacterized protein n=1 Tax=Pleuronectes platessa TaxID=8262 RepID=A0A9N7YY45_PLEPL|nr:unnamed protein product [Pleuronectes platessa]
MPRTFAHMPPTTQRPYIEGRIGAQAASRQIKTISLILSPLTLFVVTVFSRSVSARPLLYAAPPPRASSLKPTPWQPVAASPRKEEGGSDGGKERGREIRRRNCWGCDWGGKGVRFSARKSVGSKAKDLSPREGSHTVLDCAELQSSTESQQHKDNFFIRRPSRWQPPPPFMFLRLMHSLHFQQWRGNTPNGETDAESTNSG